MRAQLIVTMLAALVGVALAQDASRFSEKGVTFDYPKGWKVKSEAAAGVQTVNVQNDKGTQAIVQVHPAGADPKAVRAAMEQVFRDAFKGKLVAGSEKAAKRKIAGGEREGAAVDFEVAKGVAIHFQFFAFSLADKKPVVCVVFQNAAFDAGAAKAGFDRIAGSLAASGAAKPAVVEPPVKSIVTLPTPAPGGWGFRAAKAGVRLWSDRDYALTALPKEVEGGALLQRGVGDGKAWLPSGKLTVTRDGAAYAIVRWKYMGKVQVDEAAFQKLGEEGWSGVKGKAATTFPAGEAWEWRVIKKEIKAGDELGVLKGLTWSQPVLFVFK
jgi:hypothetical protein